MIWPRRVLICFAALSVTLVIGWWQVDGPGAALKNDLLPQNLSEMQFDLINQTGASVGPEQLLGQSTLVFFGFTYCPAVCPTTLGDISDWLDALGAEAEDMNVIMISVDPERDTPQALAEYVSWFHPAIRGWTGTADQVTRAAREFRAQFEKVALEDGDYTMNHTAGVFVFDATGKWKSIIDFHESREFVVPKIRRALGSSAVSGLPGDQTPD